MTAPQFPPKSNEHKLEIVYRETASLTPYEQNARHHPRRQLNKMIKLLQIYDFTQPIVINEHDVVLCGNLRWAAATSMGLRALPTVTVSGLSAAETKALILADNRIAEDSSWDRDKLKLEFEALVELGYEVELTGFDTLEIETTLSINDQPREGQDDNVDLENRPIVSQVGDLWIFEASGHRVFNGDARDAESYAKLLGGELAACVFSDPPFNIAIRNHVSGHGRVKHDDFVMGCAEVPDDVFAETILQPALDLMSEHSALGAIAFICCDWRHVSLFETACAAAFHTVRNLAIWAKTNASNGGLYRPQYELIWIWQTKPGEAVNNVQLGRDSSGLGTKGRNRSNLWTFAGANVFRAGRLEDLADHSTIKPKKLVAEAIRDVTKVGDIVLDGFLGSGTTIVACAMTGRRGHGIELDTKFVDVALRRIAQETGEMPRLSTGESYEEIAAQRLGNSAALLPSLIIKKGR